MIARLQAFIAAVHRPEGPTPLALFRIGVAIALIMSVGSVVVQDLLPVIWIDAEFGGYRAFRKLPWLTEWLGGATPQVMWGLAIGCLVTGALLLVGAGGRVTAFVALQLYFAVDINGHAGGSYDLMIRNALWLCVLAPTTATGSIDAWIVRGRPWRGRPVPAWCRFLIVFQLVLIYWTTGLQKVSAHWVPGGEFSALYYILQQPSWQLYDMSWLAWVYPTTQIATAVTWVWEVTCPLWLLALYYRATRERSGRVRATFNGWDVRTIYAGIGLFFHCALIATMNVGPFPFISFAFYPAFWTDAEWRAFGRWVGRVTRVLKPPGSVPSAAG